MNRYFIGYSLKNGLGRPSISVFLTGCDNPIKCKGCHNWELQEQSKNEYDIESIKKEIDSTISNFNQFHSKLYVSFLGGEPLANYNRNIILGISKYLKEKYVDVITIVYSWRQLEDIENEKLESHLKYIDFGVLGAYDEKLKVDNVLPSSTNQYIYDFKNSKIVKPIELKRG